MANNTSNSNFVNISQLTTVPELVDGDLLLVQTEQGTQTINFENLNVSQLLNLMHKVYLSFHLKDPIILF